MKESFKICRFCMSTKAAKQFLDAEDFISKVFFCVGIMVENDGLPKYLCSDCEESIYKFYSFKQNCMKINNTLLSLYKSAETTIKINDCLNSEKDNGTLEKNHDFTYSRVDGGITDDTVLESNVIGFESQTLLNSDFITNDCFRQEETLVSLEYGQYQKYIEQHKVIDKLSRPFLCEYCGTTFKAKSVLLTHSKSHSAEKDISCDLCEAKFTRIAHKEVHMRIHYGIRPYICDLCGKASRKRQDLIRHLYIHSDEKKFACLRCKRHFKRSGDVTKHMKSHSDIRPYECKNCDRSFKGHSGLSKHRKQCGEFPTKEKR